MSIEPTLVPSERSPFEEIIRGGNSIPVWVRRFEPEPSVERKSLGIQAVNLKVGGPRTRFGCTGEDRSDDRRTVAASALGLDDAEVEEAHRIAV